MINNDLDDGFPGHPADGQSEQLLIKSVVIKAVCFVIGAKVTDFHLQSFADQTVPVKK